MQEGLLTVGTIVLLKNATKELMIIGFFPQAIEGENKQVYDYLACPFPEGFIDSTQPIVFNKESIEKVTYYAYSDEEDKTLHETFKQEYKKYKNS